MASKIRFEARPYVGLKRLDSYADVDEVLRSTDFVQASHGESKAFFGDALLLTDGEEHLERRALISSLFSRASLLHYETGTLLPVIDAIMADLRETRDDDGVVRTDFVPLVRSMLIRISALITGVDNVDNRERTQRFYELVAKLGEAASVEWSLRDHDEVVKEGLQAKAAIIAEFLEPSHARRVELVKQVEEGTLSSEELPHDLLTLLIRHRDMFTALDDDYIWRECILALVASSQTMTHAAPHVLIHLEEWLTEHPEDRAKVLEDSDFLRAAVAESLRLHQPAPALTRRAVRDVTLRSGVQIAAGEQVALFFTSAGRDPEKWGDDADDYNPRRRLPAGVQPWGLTFGSGIHMCIGRPLVTGQPNRVDPSMSTEGAMVKIIRAVYAAGFQFDPDNPPVRNSISSHDTYESMPIILRPGG